MEPHRLLNSEPIIFPTDGMLPPLVRLTELEPFTLPVSRERVSVQPALLLLDLPPWSTLFSGSGPLGAGWSWDGGLELSSWGREREMVGRATRSLPSRSWSTLCTGHVRWYATAEACPERPDESGVPSSQVSELGSYTSTIARKFCPS